MGSADEPTRGQPMDALRRTRFCALLHFSAGPPGTLLPGGAWFASGRVRCQRHLGVLASALLAVGLVPAVALVGPAAQAAPAGQGFTITPADLAFILKQIKIAEHHAATYTPSNPCGTLVGNGPNQIPSPLVSYGLRTVDGSCNNLIAGQERFGAADQLFPRLTTPEFKSAEAVPAGFPGAGSPTTYQSKSGFVFDSEPRMVSNLIVDQTSSNPAAIAAAENPVRTQGNAGVVACKTDPTVADCVPDHETLFMPNVTTDVGLSPPYNQLFTLFGQFFDHGVDLTTKSGGTVFVPLKNDDPLIAGPDHIRGNGDDLPADQRFMVLTRAQNQPGPDGVMGTGDDVQEATNTDSPWVDQSQTYTSHPSHQVFLREYALNNAGPAGLDRQAARLGRRWHGHLGAGQATGRVQAGSPAGRPGRGEHPAARGRPLRQVHPWSSARAAPVRHRHPVWSRATWPTRCRCLPTPSTSPAAPRGSAATRASWSTSRTTRRRSPGLVPDADSVASADFASQPAGTYDDEMLNAHFVCGDGRCNENIGLTAIHQIFHSEHDRLVGDIKNVLTNDTSDTGVAALPEWKLAYGCRRLERRAPVPGRPLHHRDGVPAHRVRGVRPQGRSLDQPVRAVRVHPDRAEPRNQGRVRACGLPVRALDADRLGGPDQRRRLPQRHSVAGCVPQPAHLHAGDAGRTKRCAHLRTGCRLGA